MVGGPCNHAGANFISAGDEVLIDVVHMLPKIFRSRGLKRENRIYMARDLKNAASDRRKDFLYVEDDAVVEGMSRAVRAGFTKTPHHERLDIPCLDLDENDCARTDGVQRLGK